MITESASSPDLTCRDEPSKFFIKTSLVNLTPIDSKIGPLVQQELECSSPITSAPFSQLQEDTLANLEIDNFISTKYIAHLFGDSFLEETRHVGWFIGDALLHMLTLLKENKLSDKVSHVIEDLEECLSWNGKYMSALTIHSDSEAKIQAGAKIVDELCSRIKGLAIQEHVVCPGGCKGHSVLYEIKRVGENNYEFIVYNTGDGIEKHWMHFESEGIHKVKGSYKLENIKLEKIIEGDFLERLLLLKVDNPDNFGQMLYEEILPTLDGEREAIPTEHREYMRSQRSGTCVWKMLCAYLRYNIPLSEYKYLKLKARLDVFQKWYDLGNSLDYSKVTQNILSRLIVNYQEVLDKGKSVSIEFTREELLVLGLMKVRKTFNKYQFLLSDEEVQKAETWYSHFTNDSIYNESL